MYGQRRVSLDANGKQRINIILEYQYIKLIFLRNGLA